MSIPKRTLSVLAGLFIFAMTLILFTASQPKKAHAQEIELTVAVLSGTIKYHKQIAEQFMKDNPNIQIKFNAQFGEYDELVQQTIRDSLINAQPDVGFYGLFTIPTLIDRKLAQPLDPFISNEKNWSEMGYNASMLSIGHFGKSQYGIPFSVSLPVVFYNPKLVAAAGGDPDNFPKSWDDVISLGVKINALGKDTSGLFIRMDDLWIFQALVFEQGGSMMNNDESQVAFDDDGTGQRAIDILYAAGKKAGMPAMTYNQARQQFSAGKLGILVASSAIAEGLMRNIASGSFEARAAHFPDLKANSKLPGGGNAAVMLSTDPKKQNAAWKYIKYATGPIGQNTMVRSTGYMASNSIAVNTFELLGEFYKQKPIHLIAIDQIDTTTKWYAFPGKNAIEIDNVATQMLLDVIYGRLAPDKALSKIVTEIEKRL